MHLCSGSSFGEGLLADGGKWDHKPFSSNIRKLRRGGKESQAKASQLPAFLRSVRAGLGALAGYILSKALK